MPGACAPSTKVSMPRSRSPATKRAMGSTRAVGAGDVIEQRQARARRGTFQHSGEDLLLVSSWERERSHHHSRPGAFGHEVDGFPACGIRMIGDQQLIARLE